MTNLPKKAPKREVNGILLLDKPLHFSSNQALQKVKYLFQAKKAGHTGTLDPLATGMLPICFGRATKLSAKLLESDKCYTATLQLGKATTTGDQEGEVCATKAVGALSAEKIKAVLREFHGEISQVPPMYSALKVKGEPLYALARRGIEIERAPRTVKIYDLQLLNFTATTLDLKIICSKGTYIRVLAEDIAKALNTVGYISALRRLYCAGFEHQPMVTMETLIANENNLAALDQFLLPGIIHESGRMPSPLEGEGAEGG